MLTLLALLLGLAAEQQTPGGTYITADEIAATLKQSIANNVVDQPIKATNVPGGHKASLALLRRTKPETTALVHDYVTEIYQIVEGAGTLVTGGTLEDPKKKELTPLNAGQSHTRGHRGGGTPPRRGKDGVILPAGAGAR